MDRHALEKGKCSYKLELKRHSKCPPIRYTRLQEGYIRGELKVKTTISAEIHEYTKLMTLAK